MQEGTHEGATRAGPGRALVLFGNFFLIILAYYQVKSASRSLLIEHWGADRLPDVWIASALILFAFTGFYHRLVERVSRLSVVLGTCATVVALLVLFRILLASAPGAASLAFYVFVDIFSVVLVEQFWSLSNTITRGEEGRRTYWFVASGGLVGGVAGGALSAALVRWTPMGTADLLLSCALLIAVVLGVNAWMGRAGYYRELPPEEAPIQAAGDWRALFANRYIVLIAATLFCAQLAQPVVEFQFMKAVEGTYPVLDERTTFLSGFFGVLGLVAIGVNLVVTPLVHRYLGVIGGLSVQPLMLALFSFGFMVQPTLFMASAMKVSDRGLSYSINRASKELLYIPVDPVSVYRAKAWIDMLGYRLFKVAGSLLIKLFTQWLPVTVGVPGLGWLTLVVCATWLGAVALLAREYRALAPAPVPA